MYKVKEIEGYPAYSIDTDGRIISHWRKKPIFLKQAMNHRGYPFVILSAFGEHKTLTVHSLVARTFLGPRPLGYTINHKNGIKSDNRLANLEYLTDAENKAHAVATGLYLRGEKSPKSKLTEEDVRRIRSDEFAGKKQVQIAEIFGIHQSNVSYIRRNKTWINKSV